MKHYNPSITDDATRIFNLKGGDTLSEEVIDNIQPVIELKPRINIVRVNSATNSTTATVYNTPSDKDFYLTSCQMSVQCDVTSTATNVATVVTIDGVAGALMQIRKITLTPTTATTAQHYNPPIKLDRNTIIQITAQTNVANITVSSAITGYTQETTKGV